ncbi:hypothetical protein [Methyloprofundus sp.]|uniref:hypothetical protein n=1 Tax=Methyloprofundus sp. TaxID=2020875 RepID=UPI003D0FD5BE
MLAGFRLYINTAHRLKGSVRRIFMAETVELLGSGGASIAEEKLGSDILIQTKLI